MRGRANRRRAALGLALVALVTAELLPVGANGAPPEGEAPPEGATSGPPAASASPAVLTADRVIFETASKRVIAEGHVELSRDERRLFADRITYDAINDRAVASGNVVLLEPTGQAFYGDTMDVTGDLRDATIAGFKALLGEQIRLASATATRIEGSRNVLDNAVYSACPVCADRGPLWQIKAQRVVWDQADKTITYRHATFELFGVPVFYTPYFSQPDPTVKAKTGLLAPTFGTSSELGFTIETPVYVNLAPNRDLTITPLFTSQANPLLALEFRDRENFGDTMLGGSGTYTDAASSDNHSRSGQEFRGHIIGNGRYTLSPEWNSGFNLFWTTDDTYLRRYDISNSDLLTNDIYMQRIVGGDFLGVSGYAFQGLRDGDRQKTFPVILPLVASRLRSSPLEWGSRMTLDSSTVALTRVEGIDTRRASSEVGWEVPWIGALGTLFRFRTSLRGDVYNYNGDPETLGGGGGNESYARGIPRATLDWNWPLVGDTGGFQYYLEPISMVTVTPYGLNSRKVPDEDSQEFEFDETNLFEPDRFNGYDLVDDGFRVSYGLRFGSLSGGPWDIGGVFGQSWQPKESDDFPADSGVNGNFSDYVGRLDFRPSEYFSARYRFRIDKENLTLRRSDIKASIGPSRARLDISYINLTQQPEGFSNFSREEIAVTVRVQPTENLAIGAQARRDLSRNSEVSNMLGILYTHPCLQLLAGVEQDFTNQGDLKNELTFKVRVTLTTLGSLKGGY